MNLPIPTHLQPFLLPVGTDNDEFEVTGIVRCPCNCEEFEVFECCGRHIVKLICKKCGREILLFDAGKHGWDGFVCQNDFLDRSEPPVKFTCPKCGSDAFRITVRISSQGKQDFEEECLAHDDSFSIEDWVDAFEWITVSLSCGKCGREEDDWLDLETM